MRKFSLSFAIVAAVGGGILMTAPAQAALVPTGLANQLDSVSIAPSLVEKAQFIWGGRNYCFYFDGWHGPGWYWCGYAHRRGFGWGGPSGWHGWHHGGRRHGPIHRGPIIRGHGGHGPARHGGGHGGGHRGGGGHGGHHH